MHGHAPAWPYLSRSTVYVVSESAQSHDGKNSQEKNIFGYVRTLRIDTRTRSAEKQTLFEIVNK